ncbi:hypothetical protein MtrunA17_Chr3g0099191 [Medicago truncatula]|uniref:Uncharacterized protein n=1 Tax=Medicago truncatula TaxID=3880 RepID=A0A396IRJ9_MEDTR|nr:hypothetical protein MtrunA17_Chr3g0099191 [Medicago truncatula]
MLREALNFTPLKPIEGFPSYTVPLVGQSEECFPSSFRPFTGCSVLGSTPLPFLSPFNFIIKLVSFWRLLPSINIGVGIGSYSPTHPRPNLQSAGSAC